MIHDIPSMMFSPAIGLMNRLSFSRKFIMLGAIAVVAVFVGLYSLSSHLNTSIQRSRQELQGIDLVKPMAEVIQLLQVHRGLSSGVLGGISDLEAPRAAKTRDIDAAIASLDAAIAAAGRSADTWKKIQNDWRRIRNSGQQWTRAENFAGHTRLIDELLQQEAATADDFGLTSDPDLDAFYLIYTANNEILRALEHLGQIRAIGTGILGEKKATEQQIADMKTLISLLNYTLKPLKLSLDKAMRYNPDMRNGLASIYDSIETSSRNIVDKVHGEIFDGRFSLRPAEFFAAATAAIDQGYVELYKSLLPTVASLIEARIRRSEAILLTTVGVALLLLLLVVYFMAAIHYGTLHSIDTLSDSVTGFVRGNLKDRVQLETRDELVRIGHSFNRMADELDELVGAKQAAARYARSLIEVSPDALMVIDLDGKITDVNLAAEVLTGLQRSGLIGSRFVLRFTEIDKAQEAFRQVFAAGRLSDFPLAVAHMFGRVADVLCNASVYRDEADVVCGAVVAVRDVTERKKAEEDLRIAATVFESTHGMFVTDNRGVIVRANRAFARVTGYAPEEVIGQSTRMLSSGKHDAAFYAAMWQEISRSGSWEGEVWNRRKYGEIFPEYLTITAVKGVDGAVTNYVATLSDISASKAAEEEIRTLAYYDPLTRLPNRLLLLDRLEEALASSARDGGNGALLLIGLDRFKQINDTLGYEAGHQLVRMAALRLVENLPRGATAARLAGGEFAVLMPDLGIDAAAALARTEAAGAAILRAFAWSCELKSQLLDCTASIGATCFDGSNQEAGAVLKQADGAMCLATADGGNALRLFALPSTATGGTA